MDKPRYLPHRSLPRRLLIGAALCAALAAQAGSKPAIAVVPDTAALPSDQARYPAGVRKQPAVASQCMACHGPTGISQNPAWPNLAGQHQAYLLQQLQDFKSGKRQHPMMAPVVATLSAADLPVLAAHFAAQAPALPEPMPGAKGSAPASAAACMACHEQKSQPATPSLAAQKAVYLDAQLRAFRAGKRQNPTMDAMARNLSDADIRALVEHFSALAPAAR